MLDESRNRKIEARASRWLDDGINWSRWEREMRGRAVKARAADRILYVLYRLWAWL